MKLQPRFLIRIGCLLLPGLLLWQFSGCMVEESYSVSVAGDEDGDTEGETDDSGLERPIGCTQPTAVKDCSDENYCAVPTGCYLMGSSSPMSNSDETPHWVALTAGLWVMNHEVTIRDWNEVMGTDAAPAEGSCATEGDKTQCPMRNVNWFDAVTFANAMSKKGDRQECYQLVGCEGTPGTAGYACASVTEMVFGFAACSGYRLPTEAEWEYIARGGTTTDFYTGDLPQNVACTNDGSVSEPVRELQYTAWYCNNSGGEPHPVGTSGQPNAFGIRDLHGNVSEWVWDAYGPYEYAEGQAVENPTGAATGERVIRGGSYLSTAQQCRSAARGKLAPNASLEDVGFRLVLSN